MTDFESRCAALNISLETKKKRVPKPMSEQQDHQLIATIKNPMVLEETRSRALAELESRAAKAKADAPK